MPSILKSKQVRNGAAVPTFDGQESINVTAAYVATGTEAAGDIVEMHGIPANALVTDMVIHNDGFGTTVDVGYLSGELGSPDQTRTIGKELAVAAKTSAAGIARLELDQIAVAKSESEKPWGIKLTGAPVAGKTIRVSLTVQPAPVGL